MKLTEHYRSAAALVTLLAMTSMPVGALAQSTMSSSDMDSAPMTPAMQMKMDQIRTDTFATAIATLNDAHRVALKAIVDQVKAGTLTDSAAAAAQIDAVLTPTETKSVLNTRDQMRTQMRQAMGVPADGAPAKDYPQTPMQPNDKVDSHADDAGYYLLGLSLTRDQMHTMMMKNSSMSHTMKN